jgi:hypothetical protein
MKTTVKTTIAAACMATAGTITALPATAHADTEFDFLSPSGNINCSPRDVRYVVERRPGRWLC